MTHEERLFLKAKLAASESQLLHLLATIHDDQWTFREQAERWSLAENLEHLVLFEGFIRRMVTKILSEDPSSKRPSPVDDVHVIALREVGNAKITAREIVRPRGTLGSPSEMLQSFQSERAQTIDVVSNTDGDLRAHFFAHLVLGELDAYQWLLVIAQHTERHIAQMKTVMSDAGFPK